MSNKKNEKIRVMHIVQCAGGVERYLELLVKYFDKEKFEHILVCSYDYDCKKFKNFTYAIEQLAMVNAIEFKKDICAIIRVRELIKKYKPDVIYCHSSKGGAIGRVANIGIKNFCVYNPHGWAFNMQCGKRKQIFYAIIERFLACFCERIVCISDKEKKSAISKKICSERKLQVIFNGIDIEKYDAEKEKCVLTREQLGIPENAFVIGAVGRLARQKSSDIVMQVAKVVRQEIPNVFFLLVGDGEMHEEVEKYIKQELLEDCFKITGWVDEPMEYIKLFDVGILLSRWEGFGLVLPEYMIAEKAIIATRVDAIPDIVKNEENGLLVEVENVYETSVAITRLYKDNELKFRITRNAYEDVHKRFNARRVATEHEVLFARNSMR